MSKLFAVLVTGILSFLIILSGCNEQNVVTTGDTDKVEITDYAIETQKHLAPDLGDWVKIADGFSYSEEAERYYITGTIKNIAGNTLVKIDITVDFYDYYNNLLRSITDTITDLEYTHTTPFEFSYWNTDPNFHDVHHLKFKISVT